VDRKNFIRSFEPASPTLPRRVKTFTHILVTAILHFFFISICLVATITVVPFASTVVVALVAITVPYPVRVAAFAKTLFFFWCEQCV